MKKYLSLMLCISILLYGCAEKEATYTPKDVKSIVVDMDSAVLNMDMTSIIDTSWYKIVPLETSPQSLVGGKIKGLYYRDGKIYVYDTQTETITMFDDDGKFIAKIKDRGEGPHEYLGMSDVRFTDDAIYVYDLNGRKILQYDKDCRYVKTIFIKDVLKNVFQPNNVFVVGDRVYMVDYMLDEAKIKYGDPHKVCAMDMESDSVVYTKYLPYDISTAPSYQFYLKGQKYSVNGNGEVHFMCGKTDTIYAATKDDVCPAYVLDFGDKALPVSMMREVSARDIRSNPQYEKFVWDVQKLWDLEDYIVVEIFYSGKVPKQSLLKLKEVKEKRELTAEEKEAKRKAAKKLAQETPSLQYFVWYNKKTGETHLSNGLSLPAFTDMKFNFTDADGNYILEVKSMNPRLFDEDGKMRHVSIPDSPRYERELNEVYSSITPNSNPVVVIYKMK